MGRRLLQTENYFRKNSHRQELGPEHSTISSEGTWKIQNTFCKISFIYNQKVPATEELDRTNAIEDTGYLDFTDYGSKSSKNVWM